MATILLCHGGWSGAWIWRRVIDILRVQGHVVFAPTYTGLGERRHLLSPEIDLDTHIEDVRGVIHAEQLDRIVLVGHSYGGMVITGVADTEWQNIDRLVYLDAFLPRNNQSLNHLSGAATAPTRPNAWKTPRRPNSISTTLSEADQKWIAEWSSDHPTATFTQPISIDGNHLKISDKVYILATEFPNSPFTQFADWTRAQADWTTLELPTHHHMMASMPDETATMLVGD